MYDEDWTVIALDTAVAGDTELTVGLGNTEVRGCYVELYVEMADSTTEVVVRWWRLRGYPVVPAVQQWLLPDHRHGVRDDGRRLRCSDPAGSAGDGRPAAGVVGRRRRRRRS